MTTTVSLGRFDQRGFTLAELLVAAAVTGMVMAGLLAFVSSGSQAYLTGSNQIEAQELARVALDRMVREIRGAGYNPLGLPPCSQPPPCLDPIAGPGGAGSPTATGFTIQSDNNGNGVVTDSGERISYTLTGTTLNRQALGVDATPQPVIGGVQALTFTYWDAAATQLSAPVTAANIPLIRSIQIQITTQPENLPATWAAGRVVVGMTAQARIRNR